MTTGLTNSPTGGDSAVQNYFCAIPAAAAETAASGPSLYPNVNPNLDPNLDPNINPNLDPNSDSWRLEVAARLERYRTRRKPRTPRYPSLLLPFDVPESWSRPVPPSGSPTLATAPARQDFAFQKNEDPAALTAIALAAARQISQPTSDETPEPAPEQSAKVIEFPRSAAIPVFHPSELADPIFDRPRIVEAPEILPPPPALGGILIEPAPQEPADRRAAADSPLPSASIFRRTLAVLVDGVILAIALAAFVAIFLRLNFNLSLSLNRIRGPFPMLIGPMPAGSMFTGPTLAVALGALALLLWAAYEFLFVVYTGSTPGLRAARLKLASFDGSPLNRRRRRWRVLASFLSGFSAGLGFLWCVLDQDGLCWHDRITRTHVQAEPRAE